MSRGFEKLFDSEVLEKNMENKAGLIGLKIIRKQRKYSQLKVAMDLSVSREALSHYENGNRNPDLQMLRTLSEYFNVSIDFLVNGKEFNQNSDLS